jgi:hypothetical protein
VDVTRAVWRKSSYSSGNGGQCVEVACRPLSGAVAVRDSKNPGGPVVTVTPEMWRAFTNWVKAGAFDPA